MPGKNCAIVGCGACKGRHRGLSFFSIRQRKKCNPEWEQALFRCVNRSDDGFNIERATICSRHFAPECILTSAAGQRSLVTGSLPTLYMPQRSLDTPKLPPRKPPMERPPPHLPEIVTYYSFTEVAQAAECLPTPWIRMHNSDEEIVLGVLDHNTVKLQVNIRADFMATVKVFGFSAAEQTVNIEILNLKSFLTKLHNKCICQGVTDEALQNFAHLPNSDKGQVYFRHVIYKSVEEHTSTVRSKKCFFLTETENMCRSCQYVERLLKKKLLRAEASRFHPIKANNPLHLSQEGLKDALKHTRKHSKAVNKKLEQFKNRLDSATTVPLNEALHTSLKAVMENKVGSLKSPLTQLFWQEQLKAFGCKGKQGMRWHPTMIRLAILLHSRSPAAYDTLRKTGILHLPGESTLRDYTNVYQPTAGFNKHTLDAIKAATKDFNDSQRFVVLLHDEMTIKADLVFDQRSGEMVGFINGADEEQLATHALVFYVVGVNTSLSMSLGFFGTKTATAETLYPLFWRAIGLLETVCHLKVIASVSDKSTPNQRLYDMQGIGSDTFKSTNLFERDREVFFISDPPHLMKTMRNNLSKSGSGNNTRYLWLNGKHLLWQHVVDLYNRDCKQQLRMTRLTNDHVHLTPLSVMNVKLAVQVLSERVGKVMQEHGGEDCQETAKFILLMDKFFDCMNVRARDEGKLKRKLYLNPYTSLHDERFTFFEELLQFFIGWKQSIQEREGFTQSEKNKMFITQQTFRGMCMTLRSFPEICKYLLTHGVEFILSNRFCQDPLEKHFGRHRGIGRRCENPSLWAFAYNENKLRLQRSLALAIQPKGSISRKRQGESEEQPFTVSCSPLKKRKRH